MRFPLSIALIALSLLPIHGWTQPAAAARSWPLLVILDPGHGGSNNGAIGKHTRAYEKQLSLKIAQLVAAKLARRRQLRVVLTRQSDRYLTLAARTRLANSLLKRSRAARALFLSIHLNASPSRSQRGFEVYVLAKQASGQNAARLALRENDGKVAAPLSDSAPQQILNQLRQSGHRMASIQLARELRRALRDARGADADRGLMSAPFDVLLGLQMPAALVELGFIDHLREGAELTSTAVQEALAGALAKGIARYAKLGD